METLLKDLNFGLRTMMRSPGFTLVALITITLGIGANTAIFSVVNTVLLRPLPYRNPDALAVIWEKQENVDQESPSLPDFMDWRERNQSFEEMAVARRDNVNLTGAGEPERLLARMITPNFFSTLGVEPQLGRSITDEEERVKAPVVVISDGLWKRRFGGDAIQIHLCLLQLDARLQTSDGNHSPVLFPGLFQAVGHEAYRDENIGRRVELKVRGQHADDREARVVESDRLADKRCILAEPALPQTIAYHNDRRLHSFFLVSDCSAQLRFDPKRGEEIRGNHSCQQALGLSGAGEIHIVTTSHSHFVEALIPFAPIHEIR